jgi:uncharacterized protein
VVIEMQIIIDITNVLNGSKNNMSFSFNGNPTKEDMTGSDLLDLRDLKVNGTLKRPANDLYDFDMTISGTMVLPCAITLKPVDYPFKVEVSDDLVEILNEIGIKLENRLDIFPIVWENVLMEIPSKVVSPDAKDYKPKGDGWRLIRDDDKVENNALSGLKDILEKKV